MVYGVCLFIEWGQKNNVVFQKKKVTDKAPFHPIDKYVNKQNFKNKVDDVVNGAWYRTMIRESFEMN